MIVYHFSTCNFLIIFPLRVKINRPANSPARLFPSLSG
jgi:hypothetical protein